MKLKELLKYRNIWMGFAMIWIVWYHSKLNIPIGPIARIKDVGYGGVDICLFASGIGCVYSLSGEGRFWPFMKKRLFRLMPTYCFFILFWIAFRMLTDPLPLSAVIGNFFGIQYLTGQGYHFNWYISGILLFYLMAPALKALADRLPGNRSRLLAAAALLFVSFLFINRWTPIVIASRLPVFFLGMIFAKACLEEKELDRRLAVTLVLLAVLGMGMLFVCYNLFNEDQLWNLGLFWYPFILITPGFCMVFSLLSAAVEKFGPGRLLLKGVNKIGEYSFELYLVHLLVFDITFYLINSGRAGNTIPLWIAAVLLSGLLCPLLRRAVEAIKKLAVGKSAA